MPPFSQLLVAVLVLWLSCLLLFFQSRPSQTRVAAAVRLQALARGGLARKMAVRVLDLAGEPRELRVLRGATAAGLKRRLAAATGVPPHLQELLPAGGEGRPLHNGVALGTLRGAWAKDAPLELHLLALSRTPLQTTFRKLTNLMEPSNVAGAVQMFFTYLLVTIK